MKLKKIDENSLFYLSRYFNKNFCSLEPIRNRQDGKLINRIRRKALNKLDGGLRINDPRLFYVGCVDFMVTHSKDDDEKKFVLLETNGGSSRGLLSLSEGQIEIVFQAYKDAIDQSSDWETQKIILIGTIPQDVLFQEKILLIEFLKERYEMDGYSVEVYNSMNFDPNKSKNIDIIFIIANYPNILDQISYRNHYVIFKEVEVDVLIGDGIARRFPILSAYIKNNWDSVKTIIVNPIYQISDDKANTYLAIQQNIDFLKENRIKQLEFGKFFDPYNLEIIIEDLIKNSDKNYILKPFGGSGGVGIQPISSKFSKERAEDIMERSISEFYQKFDSRRTPFPYTIQEMADFSLIEWNNSKRTFDIRIYVIQKDGLFIPIGGEGRVAKLPYTGTLKKEEFVVNISGFGQIEIERAIPFSDDGLKTLNLSEDDLIDLFCASCKIFKIITENHKKILDYKDWDKNLFLPIKPKSKHLEK